MSAIDWEHVARVNLHPLQVVILDLYEEDPSRLISATELVAGTGIELNSCAYHLKALAAKGLVTEADRRTGGERRGATEVFYRLAEGARA